MLVSDPVGGGKMRVLIAVDLSLQEAAALKRYGDKNGLPSLESAAAHILQEHIKGSQNSILKALKNVETAGSA